MSVIKQMIEPLEVVSQKIWVDNLDDSAFDALRQKALMLSAQIAVHQVLQNTARHLLGPQNSSGLSNSQSRLSKFIDVMYGKPDSEKNEARWQKLRDMDCATFLFIAVSYTPLDITKMHRIEFDYLVDNASKFLHVKDLPPRWIFRKEIQIAIAGKADLEEAANFRRKYYALEFNPDILGNGQPAKRSPLEHQSPYCLEPDDQSNVSEAQVEPLDDCRSSTSAAASPTISPLTETGAGAILASIKDGAQKAPRCIQPRKRRHIEHVPEVEQFPTMETEGLTTDVTDGPALYNEHREIQYMCTNAPASEISKLPEPFRTAVQNSRLWKWERSQEPELETTGCLSTLFPKSNAHDVTVTIFCGNNDGYVLNDFFGLLATSS